MKVKQLIELLQEEIAEDASFADFEILSPGEESGNMQPVVGYIRIESRDPGMYFVTKEADTDEFGEGDEDYDS